MPESVMTPQEAVEKLQKAGLHVRLLSNGEILGGSHVDRSGAVNTVENSFLLRPWNKPTTEWRGWLISERPENTYCLPLFMLVDMVIRRIHPQADIIALPRPSGTGTQYY